MKSHRLLSITAVVLTGCSVFKSENPDKSKEQSASEAPKLVGRIASIPADKRFVLIQSYQKWNVETGTILTSRGGEDRTANLLVTGETLGQFAAADVQSGLIEVGDAVYSRHTPKPPQASPAPESNPDPPLELPENQKNNTSGNVQKNN